MEPRVSVLIMNHFCFHAFHAVGCPVCCYTRPRYLGALFFSICATRAIVPCADATGPSFCVRGRGQSVFFSFSARCHILIFFSRNYNKLWAILTRLLESAAIASKGDSEKKGLDQPSNRICTGPSVLNFLAGLKRKTGSCNLLYVLELLMMITAD